MEKNKFLTSTLILLISGFITKILGMVIKIVKTRYIGVEGIGIYMLIVPTFNLFMNVALLGFPIAVSKLVAEEKKRGKRIIFSVIPISLLLNVIISFIIILISPLISKLLVDERTLYPLMAIAFVLPFISISGIIRGYFFGKQRMVPHAVSHVSEQIVKLLLVIIITPFLLPKGLAVTVTGLVLINILSELTSIIILIFFIPKKTNIKKEELRPDKEIIKNSLNIGLPTMGSRIIGSIGSFIEPILLGYVLIKIGYSNLFFVKEYGIINGYVFPLLFIPSFFVQTIGSALLPVISKAYSKNNIKYIKHKLKQAIGISLLIGIISNSLIMLKPEFFLQLIYHTKEGANYLLFLAPFFLLYYIQVPLTITLQATNHANEAMMSTLISMIIKIIILFSFSFLKIGLYSLIIATIVNILIVTIYNYIKVNKVLNL
jgi:stage V sporulation protein B